MFKLYNFVSANMDKPRFLDIGRFVAEWILLDPQEISCHTSFEEWQVAAKDPGALSITSSLWLHELWQWKSQRQGITQLRNMELTDELYTEHLASYEFEPRWWQARQYVGYIMVVFVLDMLVVCSMSDVNELDISK